MYVYIHMLHMYIYIRMYVWIQSNDTDSEFYSPLGILKSCGMARVRAQWHGVSGHAQRRARGAWPQNTETGGPAPSPTVAVMSCTRLAIKNYRSASLGYLGTILVYSLYCCLTFNEERNQTWWTITMEWVKWPTMMVIHLFFNQYSNYLLQ